MKQIKRNINNWEIKLRDEFGLNLFKSKGKSNKVVNDLNNFLSEKGLFFGKRKPKRK